MLTEQQVRDAVLAKGHRIPDNFNQHIRMFLERANGSKRWNRLSDREAFMLLCQTSWESAGWTKVREDRDSRPKECGNYFGRGPIQLSYDYNYEAASTYLFNDNRLVRQPELVADDLNVGWDTAFWFWWTNVHNGPHANGVQQGHFGATTRAINGARECDGGPDQDKARGRWQLMQNMIRVTGLTHLGIVECGCYN